MSDEALAKVLAQSGTANVTRQELVEMIVLDLSTGLEKEIEELEKTKVEVPKLKFEDIAALLGDDLTVEYKSYNSYLEVCGEKKVPLNKLPKEYVAAVKHNAAVRKKVEALEEKLGEIQGSTKKFQLAVLRKVLATTEEGGKVLASIDSMRNAFQAKFLNEVKQLKD